MHSTLPTSLLSSLDRSSLRTLEDQLRARSICHIARSIEVLAHINDALLEISQLLVAASRVGAAGCEHAGDHDLYNKQINFVFMKKTFGRGSSGGTYIINPLRALAMAVKVISVAPVGAQGVLLAVDGAGLVFLLPFVECHALVLLPLGTRGEGQGRQGKGKRVDEGLHCIMICFEWGSNECG